jgi:ribonuclease BN (tRNA processing enzyme)
MINAYRWKYLWSFAMQIILTHEHADAVLGLDGVWLVHPSNNKNEIDHLPIFLTQFTMNRLA